MVSRPLLTGLKTPQAELTAAVYVLMFRHKRRNCAGDFTVSESYTSERLINFCGEQDTCGYALRG